jgi:hypothetical protein
VKQLYVDRAEITLLQLRLKPKRDAVVGHDRAERADERLAQEANSRLVFSKFSAEQELGLFYRMRASMCPSPSLSHRDATNLISVAVLWLSNCRGMAQLAMCGTHATAPKYSFRLQ